MVFLVKIKNIHTVRYYDEKDIIFILKLVNQYNIVINAE